MADTDDTSTTLSDPTQFQVPDKFRTTIWSTEGGPGTRLNPYGYAGSYQFGSAALKDAGLYQPAEGENLSKNEWKGKIVIPGFAPMDVNQFMDNQPAQDAAFNAHMYNLAKYADHLGLRKYIGQTVGGVPITEETLAGLMHAAGPTGAQKFLESDGNYNPAVGKNLSLASYGGRIANSMSGAPNVKVTSAPAQPDQQPTVYNPLASPPLAQEDPTQPRRPDDSLLQLRRLALINSLMPQQAAKPVGYSNVANSTNPTAWTSALLQPATQTSPLQTVMNIERMKMLADTNSTSGINPLLLMGTM